MSQINPDFTFRLNKELERAWVDEREMTVEKQKLECQPFKRVRLLTK